MQHNQPWLNQELWTQPWQTDFCEYFNLAIKQRKWAGMKCRNSVQGSLVICLPVHNWHTLVHPIKVCELQPRNLIAFIPSLHLLLLMEQITQIWPSCWPNLCLAAFTWRPALAEAAVSECSEADHNWAGLQFETEALPSHQLPQLPFPAKFSCTRLDSLRWYNLGGLQHLQCWWSIPQHS